MRTRNDFKDHRDTLSVAEINGDSRVVLVSPPRISLDNPTLVAGFPDSGMIGSISLNQIIEQLHMHQIASVESRYVMPAAIFIGKKFRHPFRIYANDSGTVCGLICEVPALSTGIYSIINAVLNWSTQSKVRKVIVLGGILPSDINLLYSTGRRPLLLTNSRTDDIANSGQADNNQNEVQDKSSEDHLDAIIAGLPGALLSACSTHSLKCTALMMPSISESPDPEGAAILLESLAEIDPSLKVDVSSLRQEVEVIKKRLQEFLAMRQRQMDEYKHAQSSEAERIYK